MLTRQSKEKDVTKHVHAIWYIIAAPVWQAHDGSLVKRLLSHVKESQTPVFVIINKADTMTTEQLDAVKTSIFSTAGSSGRLTGKDLLFLPASDRLGRKIHMGLRNEIPYMSSSRSKKGEGNQTVCGERLRCKESKGVKQSTAAAVT